MKNTRANIDDPAFKGANFNGPPYVCRCGYTTNKISTYKTHLKKQIPCIPIGLTEYVCECYEIFQNAEDLSIHIEECGLLVKKDIYEKRKSYSNMKNDH